MIGTIWPWARVAPKQRTFLWLAILLISASGLLTGLVVRPLIHTTGGGTPPVSRGTTPIIATTPTANTPTATLAPAVTTPQQFTIMLDVPTPTAWRDHDHHHACQCHGEWPDEARTRRRLPDHLYSHGGDSLP